MPTGEVAVRRGDAVRAEDGWLGAVDGRVIVNNPHLAVRAAVDGLGIALTLEAKVSGLDAARFQAIAEAAKKIDETRPPDVVFKQIQGDHPTAANLIPEITKRLDGIKKFVIDRKLVTIPGGHFDPYLSRFDQSSGAARDWFLEHLN